MKELIGLCKNCIGCNRIEDLNFEGTYKCKYATIEQIKFFDKKVGRIKYEF